MSGVLVVSHDIVDKRMAGPAIRCWEMARTLGQEFQTTLAVPNRTTLHGTGFDLTTYGDRDLCTMASQADLVVVSGHLLLLYPCLKNTDAPLVVDLYAPFILENLQLMASEDMAERLRNHEGTLRVLQDQVEAGDFFLCASERQRDFWLGALAAWNRINPHTYSDDPALQRLIDVAPFGLPDDPPQRSHPVLKGVHPRIGPNDQVVLWGGGIYDWLDPLTAIRAVAEVYRTHPRLRLFFTGTRHPNPVVGPMRMVDQAMALADDLDLTDRVVFFNDWVPYADRGAYLLEAEVGLSLHLNHLETRFAFRTRLLDCIWSGLPVVATEGDALADAVETYDLGRIVEVGDVHGVAEAIRMLLDDPQSRAKRAEGFRAAAAQFRWGKTLRPLIEFAREPRRAPDKGRITRPARTLAGKARSAWRRGGPRQLLREVVSYLRWQVGQSRGMQR